MQWSNTTLGPRNNPPKLLFEGKVDDTLYATFKIYYFIIDAVFCLPTTLGNILVLVAVLRFHGLRKTTSSILIGNLAISDILVGAVVFPVHMLLLMHEELSTSITMCLLHHSLIYTLVGASVFNLFLLSLERFHAIMKPFSHRKRFSRRRMYFACAFIWVTLFAYGFLPLFGWHNDVQEAYFVCGLTQLLTPLYYRIITCVIALSLIINAIFFFIIANIAMRAAAGVDNCPQGNEQQERTRKDVQHTKMLLLVSGLFIVFWAPYCVMTLVPEPSTTVRLVTSWCASLGLVNSCVNWIVYGVRSEKFRLAFKAILTCRCKEVSGEISNMIT